MIRGLACWLGLGLGCFRGPNYSDVGRASYTKDRRRYRPPAQGVACLCCPGGRDQGAEARPLDFPPRMRLLQGAPGPGQSPQAVDSWERGISLPSFTQLIAFCDLFEWPTPLGDETPAPAKQQSGVPPFGLPLAVGSVSPWGYVLVHGGWVDGSRREATARYPCLASSRR
jgi:hypothetical protein